MTFDRTAEATALSIVRFVLDRIDEDESELDRLARGESRTSHPVAVVRGVQSVEQLRANLIAKRHVIGDLQQLLVLRDLPIEAPVRRAALAALLAMCVPYRGHRRFDPRWVSQDVLSAYAPRSAEEHPLSA